MNSLSSREEELFAEALARPPAERGAFLAHRCGPDVDLLARLVALLAAHEAPDSLSRALFADLSAAACAKADLSAVGLAKAEEQPGARIGRYKLLQRIGEGGCGVVWMAEQEEPVRRRVALKVIKLGMDTKAVVARFEAERQALAMMDHPNIAKVYDAGVVGGMGLPTHEFADPRVGRPVPHLHLAGRPYFVMELIRGIPITKYCDENQLTPTARLELFIKVCQAIQHAHQKGVIHRDIKPSNILVTVNDGQPTPKVIDFGIAKATQGKLTDATVFTAFEQFIGTPVYMSPEQAEMSSLDIDTRSDIYSLGVLLYELLTGRPPLDSKRFARAGVEEIRHHIRTDEPPRPSARLRTLAEAEQTTVARLRGTVPTQLSGILRGDLDWIVMRCLEKDRTRRYDTANGLAMDLQRHLRHEPVTARPPSSWYLLQKLVRRHRFGFAAAGIVLGVVVVGAVATAAQATRALRAERQQHELQEAARQAQAREADAKRVQLEQAQRSEKQQWVRQRVLPEIKRLVQARKMAAALAEALAAEKHLPDDVELAALWQQVSVKVSLESTPTGADIYVKPYLRPADEWQHLGQAPLRGIRVPNELCRWLVRKEGLLPLERASIPIAQMSFTLDAPQAVPGGMVRVARANAGGAQIPQSADQFSAGSAAVTELHSEKYFIDRYEVTNRQYKDFVDRGGYGSPHWWKQAFIRDGRRLEWQEAMTHFRDASGQPGPSTWRNGTYPPGQDDHPVAGVSWYEAAAFAEFAGKRLPSVSHWFSAAAAGGVVEPMVRLSNFSGRGSAPVGSYAGMSPWGAIDMAGNVKEWCWNETDGGRRYILGGSWREPVYMFRDRDAHSPFERLPDFGFRCVSFPADSQRNTATDAPIPYLARKFAGEMPVSDDVFNAFRSLFAYQKTPLEPTIESVDETDPLWRHERVSFEAAYASERVLAHVFLPRTTPPPYQTVVYFPGTDAFANRNRLGRIDLWRFLVESGRALVLPVYQGMYERGEGGRDRYLDAKNVYPDLVVQWSKDLGRTIDYLETRREFRPDKVAFIGFSLGGALGAILPALEPRIKVNVLAAGGIRNFDDPPQVDQINYAPRITVPTLMLNGRFDFVFPEPSQRQLFRLLGTPEDHKRHILFEHGHALSVELIETQTLAWLDRYLGPAGGAPPE